ncbi:MAG TPA: nuclear transport factor 2 family protein [Nitrolancea sp.]|nr:nuclear transport factor 2 family protein [Nitrolancea sp.]
MTLRAVQHTVRDDLFEQVANNALDEIQRDWGVTTASVLRPVGSATTVLVLFHFATVAQAQGILISRLIRMAMEVTISVEEVREASDRLYAMMNRSINGDTSEEMFDIFSHDDDVTAMYSMGGRQFGSLEVRASYEMAAGADSGGSVEVSDLQITLHGNDAAYSTGTETASATIGVPPMSFSGRCTNVYRREDGVWKPVHHHADLMPDVPTALRAAMGQVS